MRAPAASAVAVAVVKMVVAVIACWYVVRRVPCVPLPHTHTCTRPTHYSVTITTFYACATPA